jgi:hypothetical protein
MDICGQASIGFCHVLFTVFGRWFHRGMGKTPMKHSHHRPSGTTSIFHPAFAVVVIVVAVFQSGCVQLARVDVSQSQLFASEMGKCFVVKEPLIARGVKQDLRAKQPDFVTIMSPPGASGPEFFEAQPVPPGTRFRIVGVTTRRSQLFPSTQYLITFDNLRLSDAEGIPVRISDVSGHRLYDRAKPHGPIPKLSAEFFQESLRREEEPAQPR